TLIPKVKSYQVDISDKEKLDKTINYIRPEIIIHLAAISNANLCENNPELSEAINVTGTKNITEIAERYSIKLLFTSTDLVFDGNNAPYTENSRAKPISVYGKHKVIAEQIVSSYFKSTIFRLPLMFGKAAAHSSSFLQGMTKSLLEGKETKLFSDEYRTPVSAEKISHGILELCHTREKLIHLGGDTRINRVELGKQVAKILKIESPTIKSVLRDDIKMAAQRPADTSLDNNLAKANNFSPGNLFSELAKTLEV
ncbi:MAG: NAD(P)-dependent oxidoreductase, partial [Bacteroidota bacterium]|nr:NAD(P)-dependent oxidoreductase [Bacteroidota bacterium]